MKYSVWNNKKGVYDVFESMELPFPSLSKKSNLGSVPGDSLEMLPPGSKHLGESEVAEGKIVRKASFFSDFILIAFASIAARWIYERFIK